ncbi:MAG TPA: TetR/AcrR family transcriptional regulator [Acholeplasma sp.]|nr:TetR/AcrR family transcriptional regulator [Acholeplasma sp.]
MDNNNKKYRNYQKTEKAIKESLIALYKEKKDINKITVKELCEVANISRSTFYLHYSDLISIFESVGDKFVESLKVMIIELAKSAKFDFPPYIIKIFKMINESNELIRIGLSSEYPLIYIENIKDQLESVIKKSPVFINTKYGKEQTLAEIRIVVSGMIDFIIGLIRSNEKIDVNKYTEILNNFLVRWTANLI